MRKRKRRLREASEALASRLSQFDAYGVYERYVDGRVSEQRAAEILQDDEQLFLLKTRLDRQIIRAEAPKGLSEEELDKYVEEESPPVEEEEEIWIPPDEDE